MSELSKENQEWLEAASYQPAERDYGLFVIKSEVEAKLIELESQLKQAELKLLSEIGIELEEDGRITSKSKPFVRAIILNKITDIKNKLDNK